MGRLEVEGQGVGPLGACGRAESLLDGALGRQHAYGHPTYRHVLNDINEMRTMTPGCHH